MGRRSVKSKVMFVENPEVGMIVYLPNLVRLPGIITEIPNQQGVPVFNQTVIVRLVSGQEAVWNRASLKSYQRLIDGHVKKLFEYESKAQALRDSI